MRIKYGQLVATIVGVIVLTVSLVYASTTGKSENKPKPTITPTPVFVYDDHGKRDPFVSIDIAKRLAIEAKEEGKIILPTPTPTVDPPILDITVILWSMDNKNVADAKSSKVMIGDEFYEIGEKVPFADEWVEIVDIGPGEVIVKYSGATFRLGLGGEEIKGKRRIK